MRHENVESLFCRRLQEATEKARLFDGLLRSRYLPENTTDRLLACGACGLRIGSAWVVCADVFPIGGELRKFHSAIGSVADESPLEGSYQRSCSCPVFLFRTRILTHP